MKNFNDKIAKNETFRFVFGCSSSMSMMRKKRQKKLIENEVFSSLKYDCLWWYLSQLVALIHYFLLALTSCLKLFWVRKGRKKCIWKFFFYFFHLEIAFHDVLLTFFSLSSFTIQSIFSILSSSSFSIFFSTLQLLYRYSQMTFELQFSLLNRENENEKKEKSSWACELNTNQRITNKSLLVRVGDMNCYSLKCLLIKWYRLLSNPNPTIVLK